MIMLEETQQTQASRSALPRPAARRDWRPTAGTRGKIWIDLDNSPHVPFFAPIIDELKKRDYAVVITARDCFQVRELADLYHLDYRLIGRHWGKNKVRKMAGIFARATSLLSVARRESPDLALSVCSRSQLVVASFLRIPSFFIGDYEYSTGWVLVRPTWMMCPEVISSADIPMPENRILKYPGIKEDVYVPRFSPDAGLRSQLGLSEDDIVATIRPPATEAHYHNPNSTRLFEAAVEFLSRFPRVKLVLLPRNANQESDLRSRRPDLFARGFIRVPPRVVNGLNLIWNSDFVISGGGTMNREAAALGVPVYSVFRGKIGAVDRDLASQGRLVLLESVPDVHNRILVTRRDRPAQPHKHSEHVLAGIVRQIANVVDSGGPVPHAGRTAASTTAL